MACESKLQQHTRTKSLTWATISRRNLRTLTCSVDRFLLPHLHLKDLFNQMSGYDVLTHLEHSPDTIINFYKTTLTRITAASVDRAQFVRLVFSLIIYARSPLTVKELLHAVSFSSGYADATEIGPHRIINLQDLLIALGGLVKVSEKDDRVSLVHKSLEDQARACEAWVFGGHRVVGEACLKYMLLNEFDNGPCLDESSLVHRLDKFPFYAYASRHWGEHVQQTLRDGGVEAKIFSSFILNKNRLAASLQVLHAKGDRTAGWHDKYPKQTTALHAAAYWNLSTVMNHLVHAEAVPIHSRDSNGQTPLEIAIQCRHAEAMFTLLDLDPNVNHCQNDRWTN
jgi:hypothetical protein